MNALDVAQKAVLDYKEACGGISKMTREQFVEFQRLAKIATKLFEQKIFRKGVNKAT